MLLNKLGKNIKVKYLRVLFTNGADKLTKLSDVLFKLISIINYVSPGFFGVLIRFNDKNVYVMI